MTPMDETRTDESMTAVEPTLHETTVQVTREYDMTGAGERTNGSDTRPTDPPISQDDARRWREERDQLRDKIEKARQERETWRAIARSRKDQVMVDTITAYEAELSVARNAVLREGDDARRYKVALTRIEMLADRGNRDHPKAIASHALHPEVE